MSALKTFTCPRCATENLFAAKFCMNCQLPLEPVKQALSSTNPVEKVVPFQVDGDSMFSSFTNWLQDSVFAPTNVTSRIETRELVGILVPVYVCNCDYICKWHGEYSQEHVTTTWNTHAVWNLVADSRNQQSATPETKKYKVWLKHQGDHVGSQSVFLLASSAWVQGLYQMLSPFDLSKAIDSSSTTGNARKAALAFDGQRAWELAMPELDKKVREELIARRITERVSNLNLNLTRRVTNLIYLPIWSWEFTYEGKEFSALMNGQTGKIIGTSPVTQSSNGVLSLSLH